VLTLAPEEARLLNHAFIGTEHILMGLILGLIHDGDGVAAKALDSLGVSLEAGRCRGQVLEPQELCLVWKLETRATIDGPSSQPI
jgi:hypothetical protein